MIHSFRTLLLLFSIAGLVLAAKSWSFSDASLAIGPKGKDATSSYTFDANTAVDETLELGSSDTLRLEFVTKEGGNRGKAHQAFILIEDPATNLDISLPIPVKASGRTKLDLEHRDLPPQFLYADILRLSLIIASFGESTPLKTQFASIKPIPDESSPEKPSPPERWSPKPEITHTFRQPQKLPNKALSGLFSLLVVTGLPLFFILLVFAQANISSLTSALSTAPIAHAVFFASLVAFEIYFFKYWVNGTLGQILVEGVFIGIVVFLSGRRALGEVMRRRTGKS